MQADHQRHQVVQPKGHALAIGGVEDLVKDTERVAKEDYSTLPTYSNPYRRLYRNPRGLGIPQHSASSQLVEVEADEDTACPLTRRGRP